TRPISSPPNASATKSRKAPVSSVTTQGATVVWPAGAALVCSGIAFPSPVSGVGDESKREPGHRTSWIPPLRVAAGAAPAVAPPLPGLRRGGVPLRSHPEGSDARRSYAGEGFPG